MRGRQDRAYGPYKRGRLWRVVFKTASGASETGSFESEGEAIARIATYNDEAQGRTLSGVLDEYLRVRAGDLKPRSLETLRFRLRAFLRVVERDRLLSQLTAADAGKLYATRVAETKADTHRAELFAAKAMITWCVKRGWVATNVFADVEPTGRKAVRTAHLRIDEAGRFLEAALNDATDAGLACAIAALFGMRATEIVELRVRDVDDGARVLWVSESKTDAGIRHFAVPEVLQKRLARKAKGRAGDERLFGSVGRHWLSHHVARLCDLAGVPVVSPHAIRRTVSAIGAEELDVSVVARLLGQRGAGVNKRHYQPGNAPERRVAARAVSKTGNRKAVSEFPKSNGPRSGSHSSSCARRDSNPHSVTR